MSCKIMTSKYFQKRKTKLRIEPYSPPRLKAIREEQNISQEKLAELSGLSRSTIAKYEAGNISPTIETLKNIGQVLNIHFYAEWEKQNPPK